VDQLAFDAETGRPGGVVRHDGDRIGHGGLQDVLAGAQLGLSCDGSLLWDRAWVSRLLMGNAVICAMDGTNATVTRKRVVIISVSLGSWVCDELPQRMTANVGGAGTVAAAY